MRSIVILGAGFGGLRAAQKIARFIRASKTENEYEVVLVDRNEHHTYAPLLYETATTSKELANMAQLHAIVAYKLDALFRGLPVRIVRGLVTEIDISGKSIALAEGAPIRFDQAVIALGAEPNDFGIPGVKERALTLKSFRDAIAIRDRVWDDALIGGNAIKIVIGGGGSTGVEFAGEIKCLCNELDKIFPLCRLDATVIEAAPKILPGFLPRVVAKVEKRLQRLGVRVMTDKKITSVEEGAIMLEGGEKIDYDLFVWTGGIKAPALLAGVPLRKGKGGRLLVTSGMRCLGADNAPVAGVYAIGDNASFENPETRMPVPQVARAAISQGNTAAKNIIAGIASSGAKGSFAYHPMNYPYIIPVGGKYAVAKIGPFVISGILGWMLKGLVELNYITSIMPLKHGLAVWFKGIKIFLKHDRLG